MSHKGSHRGHWDKVSKPATDKHLHDLLEDIDDTVEEIVSKATDKLEKKMDTVNERSDVKLDRVLAKLDQIVELLRQQQIKITALEQCVRPSFSGP